MEIPDRPWEGDAADVVSHPSLLIPVVSSHPLWLAVIGEVVVRRCEVGLGTTIIDMTQLPLFNSEIDSHFDRISRLSRRCGQDPISRLRRALRLLGVTHQAVWIRINRQSASERYVPSDESERIRQLNVVSESLSLTRSKDITRHVPPEVLEEMRQSWALVFTALTNLLNQTPASAMLFFNGRFINEGAARAAALAHHLAVFGFDQGCLANSVAIYRNHVHERCAVVDAIERTWARADPKWRVNFATAWFESRMNERRDASNIYSANFKGDVSIQAEPGAVLVSVFTSSSDELVSIDADTGSTPENQSEWIRRLVGIARLDESIKLHIRVHPNLISKNSDELREWHNLLDDLPTNVTLHLSESRVNSYKLVQVSDLVLTFGSTITAEASYLGKPVVELSENVWTLLGVCRSIRSETELLPYLRDPDKALVSCQRQQALKYAVWATWGGEPLRYAKLEGVDGSLGGVALEPFGKIFRVLRRGYRWLLRFEGMRWVQSKHGIEKRMVKV